MCVVICLAGRRQVGRLEEKVRCGHRRIREEGHVDSSGLKTVGYRFMRHGRDQFLIRCTIFYHSNTKDTENTENIML